MSTFGTIESELLVAVHEGVHEQPAWHRFLDLLRTACGAGYAALVFRPVEGADVMLQSGRELSIDLRLHASQHFDGDPILHRRMREGRVYGFEELIDPNDTVQQAFAREVLTPGGMKFLRTIRLSEPSGTDAWLTVVNDRELGARVSSLLSRIAPHFRIALHNFVTLERERMRSAISSEAMGRLNFGWLTLDAHCRIVDTTPNVDQIFRRTALVRRGRYDRLTFAATAVDRDVTALVKAFAAGREARPRAFQLSRDPWVDIFVAPVPRQAPKQALSPGSAATAIVYLSGDRWSHDDRCEQLVDLFGLLPSEARLAWAIAQGRSIAGAAEELGLTVETARNYSKKIYSKTGASGQAELVRIIFTSVLAIV